MGALNTAMNALGTVAALKSLFGSKPTGGVSGKLNNFHAEMRKAGVARTNLFEVRIGIPKTLAGSTTDTSKLSLYAEGAVIPGRTLSTVDIPRFGYGPNDKIPYSMQFNDVTLQFFGDGQGEIYKFFYNWQHSIVRGDYNVSANVFDRGSKTAFEVEYKDQYKVDIDVVVFNESGDEVLVSKLIDAFPVSVPDISLSWSESSMMQFSVTFAFFQARLENAETSPTLSRSGIQGLSPFQKAVKIATAVQTLATLPRPTSVQGALSSATTVKTLLGG